MKTLLAIAAGAMPLLAASIAWGQNGSMMNDGGWGMGWMGGYGGTVLPIALVFAVAGLVVWLVEQKGK